MCTDIFINRVFLLHVSLSMQGGPHVEGGVGGGLCLGVLHGNFRAHKVGLFAQCSGRVPVQYIYV